MNKFYEGPSSKNAKDAYVPVNEQTGQKHNVTMPSNTSEIWLQDPKLLGINLARYKFAAKMFSGFEKVLEIGCMDGFCTRVVAQEVTGLWACDFYKSHLGQAAHYCALPNAQWIGHDFLDNAAFAGSDFNGVYCLDVLEHIDPEQEAKFLSNVVDCLAGDGVFIVGMPTLESQRFASDANVQAHINCQHPAKITETLKQYFRNVFSFGMNDEVLHTGFDGMRHYQLNLCTGPRK